MKKNILLFMTAIFATILLLGMTSAAITVTGIDTTLPQVDGSFDINVTNNNVTSPATFTISVTDPTDASGDLIDFSVDTENSNSKPFTLGPGISKIVTISYDIHNDFDFELGTEYKSTLSIDGSETILSFVDTNFCGDADIERVNEELEITNFDINTVSGFGDDEDYWYLRDVIEIELEVESSNKGEVEDMEIEWAIYVDGEEVMDGSESITDLDDNDDTIVTFEIKLDENIDDFEGDVVFYIRAFGDIDKNDNEDLDGEETCSYESEDVKVVTRDDFVIVDEFKINNKALDDGLLEEKLFCGSEVTLSAQVWNIGEDDQDDVYVEIYSSLLDLYERIEVGDIDAYDSFDLEYTFTLPEDLDSIKSYRIQYEVFDEDNDIFENDEDDESIFYNYFKVEGNCVTVAPTVGAELITDAFSGKEMTVKATVRNNEPNTVLYTLSATGFDSWADSVSIEPQVISLLAGESKEVEFTFKVSSSAEGDYTFDIETTEGDKIVLTQPAAVTIIKKGFNLGALTEKENLKLAGIIALNLIFVALIIIVARKILRRK